MHSSATRSLWTDHASLDPASFATSLAPGTTTEVCVVGAGIAGLTTAYCLAREGLRVTVVDAATIGGGETGRTTAHLASALDDRFYRLEGMHGERAARLAAQSHAAAIDWIEELIAEQGIACGFRRLDGHLFLAPEHEPVILQWELEAARRAGLTCDLVDQLTFGDRVVGPALRFADQAELHPLRYLAGLTRAAVLEGVNVHLGVHVEGVETAGNLLEVRITGDRKLVAEHVVFATNTPINNRFTLHTRQAAYRSYVIALPLPEGAALDGLYWDTGDPYHYVRAEGDLLIVGGEDHKTGQDDHPEQRWDALEHWVRERFSGLGPVRHRWSGQVMEPADSLAFIGKNPGEERVYVVTGDSGHGMTHGTLAGTLLTDLICARENAWAALYDPRRSALRGIKEMARETANVAAQYTDWVGAADVRSIDQIACGTGAIVRRGLKRIAVFRDERGACTALSAACPHLGGVVAWNSAEQTWDCPCHGSRFATDGTVLNGPAISGLEPVDLEDEDGATAPVTA
jgi:glycine/D-amino acid oxidase-like deaminating enzyme/nitrite reductase/ring-hydroxylating ferredoxin subunit